MATTNINSASLESFVDRLIEEKNYENLDAEVLSQMKEDLFERVEDRINAAIVNNLPENKYDEFERLLDEADDQELQKFCQDNIPNLAEIIAEELLAFRKTYLNI